MKTDPTIQQRRGRRLAPFLAIFFALIPAGVRAEPPDPAPDGFVREDMKAIRATILRPEKWLCRVTIPAHPFYNFSPEPFRDEFNVEKGVAIHVMARNGVPADEWAAKMISGLAAQPDVLRGWTRKNVPAEPFTTYGLVLVMQNEETKGTKYIGEVLFVANRVTDTIYQCWLMAPADQWKEVEQTGEKMLASFRPDPEF